MDTTSNLTLPFIMAAQAQKHVTHNEALRALDAIVQLMVLDKDLNAPPGSPADGARYIVASSPTGAWSGQTGKVAAYQDAAWAFYTPREGWLAWAADEDKLYVWTGSAWAEFAGGGGGSLGNIVEDTTPQLGGDLDANGHNVGFDNDTGIIDDAGNEQVIFHKTVSAVNQVGVTNAATGGAPQIAAEGGDTDIDLTLAGKGSGHPKAALFGVNATADTTTRFAVAAAASLFNHAGNGHQHKINKNAAGDTASLLFQTGNSGRAEMGTAGDDDFHFKVSPDGSTWKEAIVIDRSTGAASFPFTPKRELLIANRTYYVRTDGNDSNTGLADTSGGAFLTIQKAVDTAAGLDLGIHNVTIQVRNGTRTATTILKSLVGAGRVTIQGDDTTPGNVVINTTSADCFTATDALGNWRISGFRLTTTTTGSCVSADGPTVTVALGANEYGASAANHMLCQNGARLTLDANYAIIGAPQRHWNMLNGVIYSNTITVTITGTPAWSIEFVLCTRLGYCRANAVTFSGSATGVRYTVSNGGVLFTNGAGTTFFPGDSTGSGTNLGASPYGMYA